MNIRDLTKQNILDAIKYIDENGTPDSHLSIRYDLVADDGKEYSPKYVAAVARHLASGEEIVTNFNSADANAVLKKLGFKVEEKKKGEAVHGDGDREGREEKGYLKKYSKILIESKNIIFRGAPGTGKSYLAKEIAAYVISGGQCSEYAELNGEQKERIEFVQFHPSYDYSDFVEGLRPTKTGDSSIGFERKDGVFKSFADRARKTYERECGDEVAPEERKKYVFIIDEINRGEISKIFGELFFAIDPGYRGISGAVSTQYSNLHDDPNEKFYIPENVYIIGTMNDIDRSVDTFDFAMRRRFRFIEIKAAERLGMLDEIEDESVRKEAVRRMDKLNEQIAGESELGENYQIGAAYFLKLRTLTFEDLWTDHIKPLLQEYVRGMYNDREIMDKFEKAYYSNPSSEDTDAEDED